MAPIDSDMGISPEQAVSGLTTRQAAGYRRSQALNGTWLCQPADFFQLMKPRVMSLVIFTTLVGMLLAPGEQHPLLQLIALLAIAAGAGASGAINQWYDRDMDALMERTRQRPIPAGRMDPDEALAFGVIIGLLSVLLLGLAANILAAAMLAFTILFYGVFYTIWLKRRTPQNIVIGGAAGAFPPAIGWAASSGQIGLEALVLFAIIFVWTPPHFWALALRRGGEYARAGVPMLPVVAGEAETRRQIWLYSLVLAPLGVMPWVIGMASMAYGILALSLGLVFLFHAHAVRLHEDGRADMRLFGYSILYLFLIFLGLMLDGLYAQLPAGLQMAGAG